MRNISKLILIALIAGLILSACGGAATPASTESPTGGEATSAPTGGEAATGKTKVVIFVGMGTGTDPEQITAQEELAKEFNAANDKIEIEFMIVPYEESGERYLAMVSGGNAPQLVGPLGISSAAEYFDTWADITPYIEAENYDMSDFYPLSVDVNKYPDKMVGLPVGVYPSMIFYNKSHFDAAGLPYPTHDYSDTTWTMDALRQDALLLTLDDKGNNATSPDFDPANIVQWGYDNSWESGRGLLTPWGYEGVGRPTSADFKTATANNADWVAALTWVSDGIWKDHFIPDLAGQEAAGAIAGDPIASNMVSMFYSNSWFISEALNELPFEVDIAPVPFNSHGTRVAVLDADIFTIPEAATNKDAAWEVMKWLTSTENIGKLCKIYGCIPARISAQDAYKEMFTATWPNLDQNVLFESISYADAPSHESWVPEWGKIEEAMNNAASMIYSGEDKDAKAVLDNANAEIQTILDEYWANH